MDTLDGFVSLPVSEALQHAITLSIPSLAHSLPPFLPRSISLSQTAKSFHEATQRVIKYLWLLYLSPKHNVLVFSREV